MTRDPDISKQHRDQPDGGELSLPERPAERHPASGDLVTGTSQSLSIHDAMGALRFLHPTEIVALIRKMEPAETREAFSAALIEQIQESWEREAIVRHYEDSLRALAMLGAIDQFKAIATAREVSDNVVVSALAFAEPDDTAAKTWFETFIDNPERDVRTKLADGLAKFHLVDALMQLGHDPDDTVACDAIHTLGDLESPRKQEIVDYFKLRERELRCLWERTVERLQWTPGDVSNASDLASGGEHDSELFDMMEMEGLSNDHKGLGYSRERKGSRDRNPEQRAARLERKAEEQEREHHEALAEYGDAARYALASRSEDQLRVDTKEERDYKDSVRAALIRAMADQQMFRHILDLPIELARDPRLQIMMALGKRLVTYLQDHPDAEEAGQIRKKAVEYLTRIATQHGSISERVYATKSLEEHGENDIVKGLIESDNWEIAQAAFQALLRTADVINPSETAQDFFRRFDGISTFYFIRDIFFQLDDPQALIQVVQEDKESDMRQPLYRSTYIESLPKFEGHRQLILDTLEPFQQDPDEKVRASVAKAYFEMGEWDLVLRMGLDTSWLVLTRISQCVTESNYNPETKRELLGALRSQMDVSGAGEMMRQYDAENLAYWMSQAAASSLEGPDGKIHLPPVNNIRRLLGN